MENTLEEKVKKSIEILRDKKARIYFLVQDTKGNAKGSVRLIYQMAKTLLDAGYNPIILHEKSDYAGVVAWMDEEYMSIPHRAIQGQNLEISLKILLLFLRSLLSLWSKLNHYLVQKLCLHKTIHILLKHYNLVKLGLNMDF
jgi:hypothetical protein